MIVAQGLLRGDFGVEKGIFGGEQHAMHYRLCVSGNVARIVYSPPKESLGPTFASLGHPLYGKP
jgi:hypothetical protein